MTKESIRNAVYIGSSAVTILFILTAAAFVFIGAVSLALYGEFMVDFNIVAFLVISSFMCSLFLMASFFVEKKEITEWTTRSVDEANEEEKG